MKKIEECHIIPAHFEEVVRPLVGTLIWRSIKLGVSEVSLAKLIYIYT